MNRLKNFILIVFTVLTVFTLVACGAESGSSVENNNQNGSTNDSSSKTEVTKLSIATGGITGVYFPIGAAIAQAINENESFSVNTQSTGGSIANMRMADSGEVELFLSASNTAYAGFTGEDPFEAPIEHLRSIMSLYPETFQFIVRKDSGLETLDDLKGKRIAVGAPGSGTERTGKLMLEAHGITYDDITVEFLGFGEAVTALQDNAIDVAVVGSGIPTAAVVEASSSMEINLLQVDKERFEKFTENEPFVITNTIPGGTYPGVDKDVVTVSSPALLLTSLNRSEEEIYVITKTIFENLNIVQAAHVQGGNVTLETILDGISVPLHPGAVKYFEEQGMDVSDYK